MAIGMGEEKKREVISGVSDWRRYENGLYQTLDSIFCAGNPRSYFVLTAHPRQALEYSTRSDFMVGFRSPELMRRTSIDTLSSAITSMMDILPYASLHRRRY